MQRGDVIKLTPSKISIWALVIICKLIVWRDLKASISKEGLISDAMYVSHKCLVQLLPKVKMHFSRFLQILLLLCNENVSMCCLQLPWEIGHQKYLVVIAFYPALTALCLLNRSQSSVTSVTNQSLQRLRCQILLKVTQFELQLTFERISKSD